MIRLGTSADLAAATSVYRRASLCNAGDRDNLLAHPKYLIAAALINRIVEVLRARGVERLEVTANPHALGFYRAAGFIDCGVAETEFGAAPRMELAIP